MQTKQLAFDITTLPVAPVVELAPVVWGLYNGPYHRWHYDETTGLYVADCDKRLRIWPGDFYLSQQDKPTGGICPVCKARTE